MKAPFLVTATTSFLVAAALLGGCSSAPKNTFKGEGSYFGASTVKRYQLENGLKILILEDHSAPTFAFQVWYNVGSRDEEPGLTGLAHLFEHMMFKETKNLKDGEFDRILESAGVEGENAFTSKDFTAYVQSLPSDKLDLIAKLEAERMVNLVVNEESLNKEREVVKNERRFRTDNSPDGMLYEKLYETSFAKHSYHWPVIGYETDLNNAKAEQCLAFYKRFYAPNNAVITIVGDVNPSTAVGVVEKHFGKLPRSQIQRRVPPIEPRQLSARQFAKKIKSPVEKVFMGYHIPSMRSAEFAAFEVLRNLLAVGKSSRLHRRLVDGGLATSAEAETGENIDPSLFLFFVNLQKGKSSAQALAAIDEELGAIAKGKVSSEELARAISMHRFTTFDGQVSNHAKAQFLGFYETVAGGFERGVQVINELSAVKKEDLSRVVQAYLKKEQRTTVIGEKGN